MSAQTKPSEYMLLFRGHDWDKKLSPDQLQQTLNRWAAWYEQLIQQGKIKSAHPLTPEGRVVLQKKGQPVSDGPFAESKEAIGGYFLLQDTSMEDALRIAKKCPLLEYGMTVEVRPVAEQCPSFQRLSRELASATA